MSDRAESKPMGPRRRRWEQIRKKQDRLMVKIRQFNQDLASVKENNPNCRDLPIDPLPPLLTPMPPMPPWEE
jgi:hypothetical protein